MVVPSAPGLMTDAGPNRPVPTGGKETVRHGPLAGAWPPSLVPAVTPEGVKPQPITDMLIQDVRVLAIGQNVNVSSEKPEVVHSATLEVTPAQVAKLTLGQSVGTLALALRPLSDKDHTAVALAARRRPARRPGARGRSPGRSMSLHVRTTTVHAAAPAAPSVEIVRGGAVDPLYGAQLDDGQNCDCDDLPSVIGTALLTTGSRRPRHSLRRPAGTRR